MNILDLLDRPIAYHRVLATLTGSVKAAVLLSQALYWQKRAKQPDGWWYKSADEWEDETGLTRREQETARRDCADYLLTDLRGVPATLYWKIDEKSLSTALLQICENRETGFAKTAKLVSTKTQNINSTETTTETTHNGDKSPNLSDMPLEWQVLAGAEQVVAQDDTLARRKDAANLIAMGFGVNSKAAYELVMAFQNERGITFTESDIKAQRKAVKALLEKDVKPNHVQEAVKKLSAGRMTFTDLFGIVKTAVDLATKPFQETEMTRLL